MKTDLESKGTRTHPENVEKRGETCLLICKLEEVLMRDRDWRDTLNCWDTGDTAGQSPQ